jgi:hypothetical protein
MMNDKKIMNLKTAKKLMSNVSYSQSRNRVNNRPVKEILLDEGLLVKKFDEQDGKCYWSGLPLKEEYNYIKHHPLAISVERLDNRLGYTYENTVLTRRLYNLGRMAFPEDEFRKVLKEMNTEIMMENETRNP